MRPDSYPYPLEISLPTLSDESAVELSEFLQEFILLFESHYFGQIHRFYQQRSQDNLVQPDANPLPAPDDPPF